MKCILKSGGLIQGELDAVLASLSDFPNLPGFSNGAWFGLVVNDPCCCERQSNIHQ